MTAFFADDLKVVVVEVHALLDPFPEPPAFADFSRVLQVSNCSPEGAPLIASVGLVSVEISTVARAGRRSDHKVEPAGTRQPRQGQGDLLVLPRPSAIVDAVVAGLGGLTIDELKRYIAESHRLVASKLTRKLRAELGLEQVVANG